MYSVLLVAHSWLRWLVLAAAIVAVVRAVMGWIGQRGWTRADERAGLLLTASLDLQLLIGLLLYFVLSPFMETVRDQLATAMRESSMRYWLVEHPTGMLIAVALAHVGRTRIRKAVDLRRKHRQAAIFFGLALVAIIASIPWPGRTTGRPLLRSPAVGTLSIAPDAPPLTRPAVSPAVASDGRRAPATYFREMVTPPFVVLTRRSGPPAPKVVWRSRSSRP